jgi:hypothetical protein
MRGMPTYKAMLKRLSIPKTTRAFGSPFLHASAACSLAVR